MITDKIKEYLELNKKEYNQEVIDSSYLKFKQSVIKQFMKNYEARPGNIYTTLVTKPCARQSSYTFHGFEGEPLSARVSLNFFNGDLIELTTLMLAELAGVPIESNNEYLYLNMDKESVVCKPDGIFFNGKEYFNVEIKKMSDYAYDRFESQGLTDEWGYESQASMEVEAWRQNKKDVSKTIFIAIKGLTGNICERIVEYKPELVKQLFNRVQLVRGSTKESLPDRYYKPEMETYYKKPTGREKLGIFCSYCQYKKHCWPNFKLEFTKTGTPIYIKQ